MKSFLAVILLGLLNHPAFSQLYDESKVAPYALPELLRTKNGKRISKSADWENIRRPELLALFSENVYGAIPTDYAKIEFKTTGENRSALGGLATLKQTDVVVTNYDKKATIHVILFIPNDVPKPGVFLLINNRSRRNVAPDRDTLSDFAPVEMIVKAGYSIAAFHVADAAPDDPENYADSALRLYPELLGKANGIKALGAWGWGASRVMDYFEKEPLIDSKKVMLVGHSRGGKAALWAAASDKRFASCIANEAGNSGAALSRRKFGETIERINTSFPYWFNDNYKKYNDRENELPVDQHMLLALLAPRPLYVTNATEDLWGDPIGCFLALKEAEKAYNLYEPKSSLPTEQPVADKPFIEKPLAYHNRTGKHNMTKYDWGQFLRFADLNFK